MRSRKEIIGLIAALAAAAFVLLLPTPAELGETGQRMAALFVLILILWSTEALPIAITSLLALVLQPILGLIPDLNTAYVNFIGPVFFFVLVMFIIALAWVKTGLAHRFSLMVISIAGTNSRRVIYAFVIGTGMISTIVSDVPTCAIFMAVAIGMFERLGIKPGESEFAKAIMLGIPFGAMIGGVGTIAGSSINVLGLQIVEANGGPAVSFAEWAMIGLPMVALLLPTAAFITARAFKSEIADIGSIEAIRAELRDLGPLSGEERKVLVIQSLMLGFWVFGPFDVVTVGVFGAMAMFLPGIRLFTWKEAQDATGWQILMMAGAVASLGVASSETGLAEWLVSISLGGLVDVNIILVLALISAFTVVVHLMLPVSPVINAVMIPPIMLLAVDAGINPTLYALPIIFTASCAMLLPLDPVPLLTFSKGYYNMFDMFKPGVMISIVWVVVMTLALMTMGTVIGLVS
jgi:sodium-dependent dicarboxylate transporter 2/3/5